MPRAFDGSDSRQGGVCDRPRPPGCAAHRGAGSSGNASPRRLRHPWLYALPGGALPERVTCSGAPYRLVRTFKHDFFAATGLYEGPPGLAVLKINRVSPFFGIPMLWAGKFLARREVAAYRAAAGLRGVPALLGPVGPTGFMHTYVPGRPLERYERVSDTFFDELRALLRDLHARSIAYVDLNKRQNILLGDDGRPYLIDFQIAWLLPPVGWRRLRPVQWFLRRFQQADCFHYLKHKRRLRPDLLTGEEKQGAERVSGWIQLHRWIARPLTHVRRRILKGLGAGDESEVAGSSSK